MSGKTPYVPGRHPRGREGQWIDAPDRPRVDRLIGKTVAPASAPASTGDGPRDEWDKYIPPFDDDVKAIHDQASAEAFFKAIGIEAHLGLSGGVASFAPDAQKTKFYRELAQATKDALARSPSLTTGKRGTLRGISTASTLPPEADALNAADPEPWTMDGVWGAEGPNPRKTNMSWFKRDSVGDYQFNEEVRKDGMWIGINDTAGSADDIIGHYDSYGRGLSAAGSSIYGRFTHELGHAVSETAGLSGRTVETLGDHEIGQMERVNLTPRDVEMVSTYGAASPPEAWAEIYAALNTPHGMDGVPFSVADKMRRLQADAVHEGFKLL